MRPKSSDPDDRALTGPGPPGSTAPAHVVELLVLDRAGHRPAFVLQGLPQGLRPVADPWPHPPEILLGHLAEGAVGLLGRYLVGGVVEHEHRRPEPVFE